MWMILLKIALPAILQLLLRSGQMSKTQAWGIKTGTHILTAVKVEDTYAPDKNTGITTGNIPT